MAHGYVKISPARREEMYIYWGDCRSVSKTAKHFGHSRTTVQRMMAKDGWLARYKEKVLPGVQAKSDKEVVQRVFSNVEIVRKIKGGVVNILVERLKKKKLNVSLHDLVELIKLETILVSETPVEALIEDGRGQNINLINYFVTMTEPERVDELRKYANRAIRLAGLPAIGSDQSGNGAGPDVPEHVQ